MHEYLEDVDKGQLICVKSLHDQCGCFRCRAEREAKATPMKVEPGVNTEGINNAADDK